MVVINELVGALIQLCILSLLPFGVWFFSARKKRILLSMDWCEKGGVQQTIDSDDFVRGSSSRLLPSDVGGDAEVAGGSDPCRKPVCRYGHGGDSGCADLWLHPYRTFGGNILSRFFVETISDRVGIWYRKPVAGFVIWPDAWSAFRDRDSQCLVIDFIDHSSRYHRMVSGLVE